jgi:two-component system response regulator MprA
VAASNPTTSVRHKHLGVDRKRVVLLVDDDLDSRAGYAEWLAAAGFTVEVASTGAEAVAMAAVHSPDAIIMDLQMPVMDGWEATRQIRASHSGRPYILALTAHHASDANRAAAYDAGCDDLVGKPLGPDILVAIVAAALRFPTTGGGPSTPPVSDDP